MEYLLRRYKVLSKKERKGFTLVELLVVIAILAVLASVSVVGYLGFTTKAKNSNAVTELTQAREVIRSNLIDGGETYYYNGSAIISKPTDTSNTNYYELTFCYDNDTASSKKVLSYNCVKKGSGNITDSTSTTWTTVLKACFSDLVSLGGEFEVEASSGSISQIHYITKDKGGNATWIISDDSLSSGEYISNSSYINFTTYTKQ